MFGLESTIPNDRFARWIRTLEARHLAELSFPEVSRGLRALSSAYVERRSRLARGAALDGAGKRAAFALFYGPLHYLIVREIVREIPSATSHVAAIVDLGCGTGAAGAAWAAASAGAPRVLGIDRHPWAVDEAARTYRVFGLAGRTLQADVATASLPRGPASVVAAFTLNELEAPQRDALVPRLMDRASRGDRLLIVEPVASSAAPWWRRWREAFVAAGGRADEWRVRTELPEIVEKLDRAAGLDHGELTARSLWLAGS